MSTDTEPLDMAQLAAVYESFRNDMTFDDLLTVAGYTRGNRDERTNQLFAWCRRQGSRPLVDSAIENALNSRNGPADYTPGSRVLAGDAMPALATAQRADGRYELHQGDVRIRGAVPILWAHQWDQRVGTLVGYERGNHGNGSLRIWADLQSGQRQDKILRAADYGRIGLSVGVFHPGARDDGGAVLLIGNQLMAEISLVPLDHAAFGTSTRVQRTTVPDRARARLEATTNSTSADTMSSDKSGGSNNNSSSGARAATTAPPAYYRTSGAQPMRTWQDGKQIS